MREQFQKMFKQVVSNALLVGYETNAVRPNYPEDVRDLQGELGVVFNENLVEFYETDTYKAKIVWKIDESKVNGLGNLGHIFGAIEIMSPYDMVTGRKGKYWKDVFWFDDDEINTAELNAKRRKFMPFDYGYDGLLATGFMKEEKDGITKMSEELYLYRNYDVVKHPFAFDEYLEFVMKGKGYHGLLDFYNKPDSKDFEQFMAVMPVLFDDFDKEYFLNLSTK